jgi:hypothetical protein
MEFLVLVVIALVVIGVIDHRIAREERVHDATATDEMWAKTLSDFRPNATMPPAVTGRRHQKSRIGDTTPTTNSNASLQV